jgi:hypothetical protein
MRKIPMSDGGRGAYERGTNNYLGACNDGEKVYRINVDSITDPLDENNVAIPTIVVFLNFVRAHNRNIAKEYIRSLAPSCDIRFYR